MIDVENVRGCAYGKDIRIDVEIRGEDIRIPIVTRYEYLMVAHVQRHLNIKFIVRKNHRIFVSEGDYEGVVGQVYYLDIIIPDIIGIERVNCSIGASQTDIYICCVKVQNTGDIPCKGEIHVDGNGIVPVVE